MSNPPCVTEVKKSTFPLYFDQNPISQNPMYRVEKYGSALGHFLVALNARLVTWTENRKHKKNTRVTQLLDALCSNSSMRKYAMKN